MLARQLRLLSVRGSIALSSYLLIVVGRAFRNITVLDVLFLDYSLVEGRACLGKEISRTCRPVASIAKYFL